MSDDVEISGKDVKTIILLNKKNHVINAFDTEGGMFEYDAAGPGHPDGPSKTIILKTAAKKDDNSSAGERARYFWIGNRRIRIG